MFKVKKGKKYYYTTYSIHYLYTKIFFASNDNETKKNKAKTTLNLTY